MDRLRFITKQYMAHHSILVVESGTVDPESLRKFRLGRRPLSTCPTVRLHIELSYVSSSRVLHSIRLSCIRWLIYWCCTFVNELFHMIMLYLVIIVSLLSLTCFIYSSLFISYVMFMLWFNYDVIWLGERLSCSPLIVAVIDMAGYTFQCWLGYHEWASEHDLCSLLVFQS
jgi:hypothetical protein